MTFVNHKTNYIPRPHGRPTGTVRLNTKPAHYRPRSVPSLQEARFTNPESVGPKDIYRCAACGAERKWGAHRMPETTDPMLNCAACGKMTKHFFARVD